VAGVAVLILVLFVLLRRRNSRSSKTLPMQLQQLLEIPHVQARAQFREHYARLDVDMDACDRAFRALEVPREMLRVSEAVLGKGAFGFVFRGELRRSGATIGSGSGSGSGVPNAHWHTVAVKVQRSAADARACARFLLEARLQAAMAHENVLPIVAVCSLQVPVLVVSEYCELGNLRAYLVEHAPRLGSATAVVSGAEQVSVLRQVANAMAYLHARLCLHRDLAARNVLLKMGEVYLLLLLLLLLLLELLLLLLLLLL
jgi:hypothetical protein